MSAATAAARPTVTSEPWLTTSALRHVLVVAAAFCVTVALVVLVGFDGWEYYRAPLGSRGYLPQHALLRPSGPIGLSLGIAGVLSMLGTLPYALRKRWRRLSHIGTVRGWLETHIFFGVVGPVLITFHTSFKFNGLISVAYWLMVLVWTSGFVGRYLYVRIPKTMRGVELSRAEVADHLEAIRVRLAFLPEAAAVELDRFQAAVTPHAERPSLIDLFTGELHARLRFAFVRRRLCDLGVEVDTIDTMMALAFERASLSRRLAHLERTKRVFELWHVFHRPLVFGLFAIVAVHVGVALFLGYGFFG